MYFVEDIFELHIIHRFTILSKIMTPLKIPIKENGLKLHQCKYYRYTAIDKF